MRASGLTEDMRRAEPYAAYERLIFDVPVQTSGDVFARIVVRALEIVQSCGIVEQALEQIPAGPIRGRDFVQVPRGEAVARIEGPRGEVFYYVASDGSDVPRRVKVRTPSFGNMPTVRMMLGGASLSDVPLIQASIDPRYACTDRRTGQVKHSAKFQRCFSKFSGQYAKLGVEEETTIQFEFITY